MTYDQLMADGTARLQDAGIVNARLESRWLLAHVSRCQHSELISRGPDKVAEQTISAFQERISRRVNREPIQHILGTTEFYGLEFLSDARALIPRPDSEVVVETALERISRERPVFIADLGTGSGCLLAALLANRPMAKGEGIEASDAAAALARENLMRLGFTDRSDVHPGSWASWQKWAEADLIISNPPYIASAEIEGLMPEVREHDPMSALDGGPDGLDAYREITEFAARGMKPGAWLVFEIGFDQKQTVTALLKDAGFAEITCRKDLGGNDRAIAARRPIV